LDKCAKNFPKRGTTDSMQEPLSIYMGRKAADTIREQGWRAAPFRTLIGASGGPKWLILSELDQVLAQLLADGVQPLTLLGSSIGTWRHACLSTTNPGAAIKRLQQAYLYQAYSCTKPSPQEVSRVAESMLCEALGPEGLQNVIHHPRFFNAIITARAVGVARAQHGLPLIAGMATATLANTLTRRALAKFFERVAFCHGALNTVPFAADFNTQKIALTETNLIPALKASGAIPLLMQCEPDIDGAPPGPYWDGGIIDYHFSLEGKQTEGLILYPHFRPQLTPGWFDKMLPWRTMPKTVIDNLVLICPSERFLAALPHGKIPDRGDFRMMKAEDRIAYWEVCVAESRRLAEAFHEVINGDNPLCGVTVVE